MRVLKQNVLSRACSKALGKGASSHLQGDVTGDKTTRTSPSLSCSKPRFLLAVTFLLPHRFCLVCM